MSKKIVTRFAPSPTGFLHVGSLRTAMYNFLFAKANKGDFLLRIEDTDQTRKVKGAQESLLKSLEQFNLDWDNKKIMVQSERLKDYQAAAEKLVKEKKAYNCFCSKERLDNLRKVRQQKGLPPMYDGHCTNLPDKEIDLTKDHVIRFKMPNSGQTKFNDLIRNKVIFDNKLLDDPVILKSDGFPTYHLASVVDDHEMKVSHVIRGEEWLPSTPKHILLHEALDFKAPEFAHLPLLLNADRSKLSKRQGDVAVEDFLKQGYLEEALLNFVLLLGWNPGTDQEIFSLEEMIKSFDLKKVHKGGALFNTQKLDWLNGEYIKQKSLPELTKLCQPFFAAAGIKTDLKQLEKVVATEQQRIKKLSDIVEGSEFFFKMPSYDSKLLIWKKGTVKDATENLKVLLEFLDNLPENQWNQQDLETAIKKLIEEKKIGVGDMLWPMRVALTGRKNSPGPFEVAEALGKEESLARIKKAIDLLS
ncbi:MAG: glutamate--tRNA ligase [Parcubacteria group bacterium]|nr:glutamate--tRNA ligase [Parcubacteria group bacterium]|tara:strand:+ start:6575 stop:7993 length:1419 start_codon:yes stop_codon:yes gene_type:complete